MSRRNTFAITAAGILAIVALVAGCTSAPLTDARKILSNAQTNLTNLQSVHFKIDAGGQFLIGVVANPTAAPTDTPTETPTASATDTPTAAPSATATVSPTPARPTGTPLSSAAASASAAVAASAAASASASAAASASASAGASASAAATALAIASASASAEASAQASSDASAAASAVVASSAVPTPTPTPLFTALPVSLSDSTASGDIDFANKTAHVVGGAPGIPNLSGEVIVVDTYAYIRAPGAVTFTSDSSSNLAMNPALSSGPLYVVQQVVAVANDQGVNPVLVGTEQEQYGPCYHIRVDVTQGALNSKLSSLNVVQALGSGRIDLWITQSGFQLERLEFSTNDPTSGAAAVRLVLSNWNNVSPIEAPPANQIEQAAPAASASY